MYPIEIIASKKELYAPIQEAIAALNGIQHQFYYHMVEERLQPLAYALNQSQYKTSDLFQWLRDFRNQQNGNRPYIILVVDVPIEGNRLKNLFGNLSPTENLAIFTTQRFNQFVHNLPRYCMYYFTRYTLSFLAPQVRSHPSVDCLFDNKIKKRDLLLSLNSGNICDNCKRQLQPNMTPEIQEAIDRMRKLFSDQYPFALIMKGGGVKGLAYAGALLVLEQYFSFDVFVGTSAGGIAAILLGADYKPAEIKEIFEKLSFQQFRDAGFWGGCNNLFRKSGFYPGHKLEDTIENLVATKTERSRTPIKDLPNRSIVYASQDGPGTVIFDSEGENRDSPASFAARCSMSIPGFFAPPLLYGKRIYDGGLKNNFPSFRFKHDNPQKPFLGLYLISPPGKNKAMPLELLDIITESEDRELYKQHRNKIVLINTGPIKTTDFSLSKTKKEFLLASGHLAAVTFIQKHYPDFDTSMYDVAAIQKDVEEKLKKL